VNNYLIVNVLFVAEKIIKIVRVSY